MSEKFNNFDNVREAIKPKFPYERDLYYIPDSDLDGTKLKFEELPDGKLSVKFDFLAKGLQSKEGIIRDWIEETQKHFSQSDTVFDNYALAKKAVTDQLDTLKAQIREKMSQEYRNRM